MTAQPTLVNNAEEEERLKSFLRVLPSIPNGWEGTEIHRANTYDSPAMFIRVYTNGVYRLAFRSNHDRLSISMSRSSGAPLQPGDSLTVAKLFFPNKQVIVEGSAAGLAYFFVADS